MAKALTVRGFRKGAKKAGPPISLAAIVAASNALHIEVDDQNGNAMTVDPTTVTGDMTSDNAGAVIVKADALHFTLTVDPSISSSGAIINLSDSLAFSTTPPGTLTDTEQVVCDLAPPVSTPTTIKIAVG